MPASEPRCPRCGGRKVRALSAIEQATLDAVRTRGECGAPDLRAAFPGVTHEALCMRLAGLALRGLLVRTRREGKRAFFRAADAPREPTEFDATLDALGLATEASHVA